MVFLIFVLFSLRSCQSTFFFLFVCLFLNWTRACISRFNDCPLCGADIEKIEAHADLQATVDRFIEGHARIKRSQVNSDKEREEVNESKVVIYEDLSMDRGAFLIQQAMRVIPCCFLLISFLLVIWMSVIFFLFRFYLWYECIFDHITQSIDSYFWNSNSRLQGART